MSDPNINELNPNHPVTQFSRDQWVKIVALLMIMDNKTSIKIPRSVIDKAFIRSGQLNVTIQFNDREGILLRLVGNEEAERLAKEEGGLPI